MEELKKELERLRQTANVEFWEAPESIKTTLEGKVRGAKADIEKLKGIIASEALYHAETVVITDKISPQDFISKAEVPKNCIVLDYYLLEKELFKKVFAGSAGTYYINSTFISRLNNFLIDIMDQYVPSVKWAAQIQLPASKFTSFSDRKDAIFFMSDLLIETYGGQIKKMHFINMAQNHIIKNIDDFLDKTVLCILDCPTEDNANLDLEFSNLRVFDKIKEDDMLNFFKNLNKEKKKKSR